MVGVYVVRVCEVWCVVCVCVCVCWGGGGVCSGSISSTQHAQHGWCYCGGDVAVGFVRAFACPTNASFPIDAGFEDISARSAYAFKKEAYDSHNVVEHEMLLAVGRQPGGDS